MPEHSPLNMSASLLTITYRSLPNCQIGKTFRKKNIIKGYKFTRRLSMVMSTSQVFLNDRYSLCWLRTTMTNVLRDPDLQSCSICSACKIINKTLKYGKWYTFKPFHFVSVRFYEIQKTKIIIKKQNIYSSHISWPTNFPNFFSIFSVLHLMNLRNKNLFNKYTFLQMRKHFFKWLRFWLFQYFG